MSIEAPLVWKFPNSTHLDRPGIWNNNPGVNKTNSTIETNTGPQSDMFCVSTCNCCVYCIEMEQNTKQNGCEWDYKWDEFVRVHVMDMLWFRSWVWDLRITCFICYLHLGVFSTSSSNHVIVCFPSKEFNLRVLVLWVLGSLHLPSPRSFTYSFGLEDPCLSL